MRILSVIFILCLFTGFVYSQEAQTQPVKPDEPEKPVYDENKPTIIFYIDAENNELKQFIQAATIGMGNLANFAALDLNEQENADKKRNILSQYKIKGIVDILCVIGKGQETDVILGKEHIAQNLSSFLKHYSNPEIFPVKPDLKYKRVETIADKFEALELKVDKNAADINQKHEEMKKHVTDTIEEQPEETQLASLIILIIIGLLTSLGVIKKKK